MPTPEELLDTLAEVEERIANRQKATDEKRKLLDQSKEALLASILTPEQLAKMEEIKAEFAPKYATLENPAEVEADSQRVATLKTDITAETLQRKETIHGLKKMCVYTPESTKKIVDVNTEMLKGLTVNIPKLQACWVEREETTEAKVAFRKK